MAGESQVKVFNCSACGAPITLRGLGQTSTVACSSCGSIIDISDENYRILERYSEVVCDPAIPLGTRGKLRGGEYEVIGFMIRTDNSGDYSWEEYLFFNPYKGFSWLMNYQGHWTFIKTVNDIPAGTIGDTIGYDDRKYKLFLSGIARVKYVLGEFYWQVKIGDETVVKDYISPPFILSRESTSDETVWSRGEYIEPNEVAAAFKLSSRLPYRYGVGACQPAPAQGYAKEVVLAGVLFALLLCLIEIVFSGAAAQRVVYDQYYPFTFGEAPRTVVTESFEIPDHSSNLELQVSAPLSNAWLSVDADLVDEQGSEVQGAEVEVGYYSGIDSDGAWTEGSQSNSALFSEIPPGQYRLSFQTTASPTVSQISYELRVTRDVPVHANFALCLALIGIFPLLLFIRRAVFESRRWQEADP